MKVIKEDIEFYCDRKKKKFWYAYKGYECHLPPIKEIAAFFKSRLPYDHKVFARIVREVYLNRFIEELESINEKDR